MAVAHIHVEVHELLVEDDGSHISHDDCPRWPSPPEGETWPACYVGAVAEEDDDPGEGIWYFLNSLPPGRYRMVATVTTYRGREDDPVVEYSADPIGEEGLK